MFTYLKKLFLQSQMSHTRHMCHLLSIAAEGFLHNIYLFRYLAHFPYFEKKKKRKVGLWDPLAACVCVSLYESSYAYQGTWDNLNDKIHKSL
jgi:hypothetical protein